MKNQAILIKKASNGFYVKMVNESVQMEEMYVFQNLGSAVGDVSDNQTLLQFIAYHFTGTDL